MIFFFRDCIVTVNSVECLGACEGKDGKHILKALKAL